MVARVCARYSVMPYEAHLALGMAPLTRRGQASLLMGVMQVTALEEAYGEFTRDGGKVNLGQKQLLEEVEREYVRREDIDIIVEEGEDVQTPTDIEAQADPMDGESIDFGVGA